MSEPTENTALMERMAAAIWHAEWEEPYPAPGAIEHVLTHAMARAALAAISDAGYVVIERERLHRLVTTIGTATGPDAEALWNQLAPGDLERP